MFHLLFNEMMITPFDFTVLTGLGFTVESLVYQENFHVHRDQLLHLLGPIIGYIPPGDHLSCSTLEDLVNDDEQWAQHSPDQQSRLILTFLLDITILADLGNRCYFHYLVSLVDLDRVRYLYWRVLAYSTLIHGMRQGVQKVERTHRELRTSIPLPGIWRVPKVGFLFLLFFFFFIGNT